MGTHSMVETESQMSMLKI